MRFRKSLFGFSTEEVDRTLQKLSDDYKSKQQEITGSIQEANDELRYLQETNNTLKQNLSSLVDSNRFFEGNEQHFTNIIHEAEIEAKHKIQSIADRQEIFIDRIIDEVFKLDESNIKLKKELSAINSRLEDFVESINNHEDIKRHLEKIDDIIDNSDLDDEYYRFKTKEDIYPSKVATIKELVTNGKTDFGNISHFPPKEKKKEYKEPKLNDSYKFFSEKPIPVRNPSFAKEIEHQEVKKEIKKELDPLAKPVLQHFSRTRPKTALIAERNKDTAEMLKAILEREGYAVTLVNNAIEITNMIKDREPFGVAIIDSLLPYIKINALLNNIRNSGTWCDLPILVLTSEHNSDSSLKYLANGANDFLEKPFNPRELVARANKLNSFAPQACMLQGG